MRGNISGLLQGQGGPRLPFGVLLDPLAFGPHDEVVEVHAGHDLVKVLGCVVPETADLCATVGKIQTGDEGQAGFEESLRQRLLDRPL